MVTRRQEIIYCVLELARRGNIYEYICDKFLDENTARFFFLQMVEAL